MKLVILFEDNATASPEIRQKYMPDHLRFLEKHASIIDAAGPMMDESGQAAGGLWIVNTECFETAQRLIEEDPFWPTGLRKSVRILSWTQVFADGQRQIKAS